jgi:hypothetical protein
MLVSLNHFDFAKPILAQSHKYTCVEGLCLMSTVMVTAEDYKFFDLLAPYAFKGQPTEYINFARSLVEQGIIHIETLLENALACNSNGQYSRIAEHGRDFTDNSDAKKAVSVFRCNNLRKDCWMNTFTISDVKNKVGLIRAVCYSKQQDRFYFYAIPNSAYQGLRAVEVILDTSVGYRAPQGIPCGKWTKYQLDSFDQLCTITEAQAEQKCS